MGVARAGTLKFARAGPTGINMPVADLSERARSHAHNQPAVMTVKLIFSSPVLVGKQYGGQNGKTRQDKTRQD